MNPRRRRILIAAGLIALAGLAYLYFRNRSSSQAASGTSPFSTGSPTSSTPASAGDTSGGGDSGGGSGSASDVLSALAGENQSLLNQLLSTSNGLAPSFGSNIPGSTLPAPSQPIQASPQPISRTTTPTTPTSPGASPVPLSASLLQSSTIDTGPDAGTVIYTPSSPAAAAAIDNSPNALTQIGSDAAQAGAGIVVPPSSTTTSVEQKTLAGSYGGGKTSGQVKKNL